MAQKGSKNLIPAKPVAFARAVSGPFRGWAFGAVCAVLVATAASRGSTYVLKLLTDDAIAFGNGTVTASSIWRWVLLFPALYLVNEVLWRASGFCGMRWIVGSVAEANRRLFGYLSEHSATYFSDRHAGALVNKISNASNGIERLMSQWLWQFFPLIIGLGADLYLTYTAHPYFALSLLGWMLLYIPVNVFFVTRLHKLSFAYAESSSTLKGKMVDSTSNVDTVQYTGSVEYEKSHIGEHIGAQLQTHMREWWWSEWVQMSNGVALGVFILAMFAFGMWLISVGEISVGALVMVIMVVINLEQRMFFLGHNMTQAVSYYSQVNEGLKELLEPHEITDRPNAKPLVVGPGEIEFKSVRFAYRGKEVFRGTFDLVVRGGE
jgi:ATP-binding cassette subfamily B protein